MARNKSKSRQAALGLHSSNGAAPSGSKKRALPPLPSAKRARQEVGEVQERAREVKAGATNELELGHEVLAQQAEEAQSGIDGEEQELPGGVLVEELETTTETLLRLVGCADRIAGRDFRAFRSALHQFHTAHSLATGLSTSLPSRISSALGSGRWLDARVALVEMRLRGQKPRLGALQRWVRECDAAAGGKQEGEEEEVWKTLEEIMRTVDPSVDRQTGEEEIVQNRKGVRRMKEWGSKKAREQRDLWEELQNGSLLSNESLEELRAPFQVLETVPGAARKPPNAYPCILYHSPVQHPLISLPTPAEPATGAPHPFVPGLSLLENVLSPTEAHTIIKMAEARGLEPDEPLGREGGASTLAHNLVWIIPEDYHSAFYARIAHLLPAELAGSKLAGINRRWRIYRYRPGALYRPHVDGAWPASSVSYPASGASGAASYVYDSDPLLYSRLTLLLYLNDGFTGGHTTYFLPATDTQGVLAYPLRPTTGGAAVFPHGNADGSLLHEGSGVGQGAKWVVRTEVLYAVGRDGRGGADK
ncbi:hypothetical protein FA09DRAFT_327752 [Tilletiopsis washingtonensis]|uniref:Prolyl 4-hydroxylase alpha subunit domain-containing protein n=1 Tax=Tilletiopsis washingtonensis TaxID=58919 RepID=A0A316ZFJ3_9BASI|nr:hypothetical protein FA09DRAFT_327752 [Tilletiopsis washingtonensis]PWO00292.1 hypothetical protein FA09DRAFT_327752 [Tilletiopsis washingtonensis]